ncbi:FkbM family methyltransferase [Geminocystis sp. CENA526]|uniref:FkbM family methyltransferase n=1 Tax=Geminocystis sp. CENA526 TaxID=1355871 RepID=UPI003D6EF2FF
MQKDTRVNIKQSIPKPIKTFIKYILHCLKYDPFFVRSYSQEGEDLLLQRFFGDKKKGFYVDVGAHHPKRFSNTLIFYRRGWNGINIDAMPGSMKLFSKERPRDINLEIPISKEPKTLTYFQFDEPALNGFDEQLSLTREKSTNYKIVSKKEIKTSTLKEILEQHLTEQQEIDFLSVDVEGLDLEVLQSNNWLKFRPKMVLVECLKSSLSQITNDQIYYFLTEKGYKIYAKTVNTVFFISQDYLAEKLK